VLLIVRPDTSGFQAVSLLPVLAAALYASAMVLTSVKCREESPLMLALALNCAFIVAGLGLGVFSGHEGSFLLGPWQTVDVQLAVIVAVLAALIRIGRIGAAIAYQTGPPATVAAFDYAYLAFSLLWGVLFFGEWPAGLSLLGIGLIAAAGLLALPRR